MNTNDLVGWFDQYDFFLLSKRCDITELLLYSNEFVNIWYSLHSPIFYIIKREDKSPSYISDNWKKISNFISQFEINLENIKNYLYSHYGEQIEVLVKEKKKSR